MRQYAAALVDELVKLGVPVHFRELAADMLLFAPGEPSVHLFIVRDGCVRLFRQTAKGRDVVLRWCGTGDLVGEEALSGEPYQAFAQTVLPTTVWSVEGVALRAIVSRNPILADLLFRELLRALHQSADLAIAFQGGETLLQIAKALDWLAAHVGVEERDGLVAVPFTHAQLATFIGTARECVTVNLRNLQASGIVFQQRKRLLVHLMRLREFLNRQEPRNG